MNLWIGSMKSIHLCFMVERRWKHNPWNYFLPKLKITIFKIFANLASVSMAYYANQSISNY